MTSGGHEALDSLVGAVDALAAVDPASYGDTESMELLHRQLARLEAVVTSAAGAFDASEAWAQDGAKNAAAWLAVRCRLPRREARRRVRLGRALRHLPVAGAAWAEGELTGAHVGAVAGCRRPGTEEALARDEGLLVAQAEKLRFEGFTKVLAYWLQLAVPDEVERDALAQRAGRSLQLDQSWNGVYFGRISLDPVSGAIVHGELERLEQGLFEADWAEAKERLGRDPTAGELLRSSAQRRADALVEMATRSKTAPAAGRRPAPLFSVFVGYETLHGRICELAQGTVVSPGSLVAWLEEADIERAVFGSGPRVEVGPAVRFYSGATRRAVELRDRRCTHPYCDRSSGDCEVDHIVPYAQGGPTTQENGRLLCAFHNRLRNQRPPPPAA